ncbi:MAG: GH92 family glycosyl hydrolase [Cyclobacteriaceae bacterium]|nr:GH92 family glycosyl hydrolase [Cyclobacteriaceae bacterium]
MNLKIKTSQIILFIFVCAATITACQPPNKEQGIKEQPIQLTESPVDMVYPFLDAANSRWFFFSSACRPFGLVNLSPDMSIDGAWNSGYRYDEDTIKFFSHVHAWQLSGIPVMPTTGDFKGHLGPDAYGSLYSHEEETVIPGYHQVKLKDYGINAELTSTTRVGFHRYTFDKNNQNSILLDLGTVLGPSPTKAGHVEKLSERELNGYALMTRTSRRPKDTYVYFHIELQEPFTAMNAWQDGELLCETSEFEGENGGVYLTLGERENPLLMKVGISYVSAEQAKLNIEAELNHWDFDKVCADSKEEWNSQLSRIIVEGNDQQQRRRFYTDLWKALQGRRTISDANGKYCDMTGDAPRIGQIPLNENGKPKFNHFNSDSFWGAQWTITTLWELVYPEIAEQFINSMLLMYDDGGLIPRGPSGGNYTHVMTGASSTPFIVGAYMKGIRNYDVEKVYEGMKKNHLPGGSMGRAGYEHYTEKGGGLEFYIERGYIPFPMDTKKWGGHQDGAGQTLEYSYQDWCLAQMAKALGKDEDYKTFMARSNNWKNLLDPETKWMRPKELDGSWRTPYDPYEYEGGFVESNAAQSTWYVPHDLPGLADMMGGSDAAADKLNESFETAAKLEYTSGKSHAKELDPNNKRIPINYGNQPSIETAFVFNHLGKPALTQKWSREIVDKVFGDLSPKFGFSGDEDQGLMGSLSALMKMGLFEMKSGAELTPKMDIGSPIFDKITIQLNKDYYKGDKIEIVTKNNSKTNMYVQKISWNNSELNNMEIEHNLLTSGGVLELEMGDKPKSD